MDSDILETNQSLGLAPAGRAAQLRPTSPEILDAAIPEGRWGATSAAEGDSALLPMIVVRFQRSTITILGELKLTASKMSRAALRTTNSVFSREGRGDAGAFVSVGAFVSALVSALVSTLVGRLGDRAGRVGVGVDINWNGSGSCESGEGESEDDFELHIVFF